MRKITIFFTLFSLAYCSGGQVKDEEYYQQKIEELREEKTKVEKYRGSEDELKRDFAYGFADIDHDLQEKKALRREWVSYMKKKWGRKFSEPKRSSCFFFKLDKPLVSYNHTPKQPVKFMTDKYMLCRAMYGRFLGGDEASTYLFAITNKNTLEQVRFSSHGDD